MANENLQPSADQLRAGRRRLWQNEDAFMSSLLVSYVDMVGELAESPGEHTNWDAAVIISEITKLTGKEPPAINVDKLIMAMSLITEENPRVFISPTLFNNYCNVLGGVSLKEQEKTLIIASVEKMVWGIVEAALILQKATEPSEEVKAFINATLQDEGYLIPPSILRGMPGIKTPDLGQEDLADDVDLYSAVAQHQIKNTDIVNANILFKLLNLAKELASISIADGSMKEVKTAILDLAERLVKIDEERGFKDQD